MNLKQALIDNDSIRLGLEAKDWKEAVKVAVDPLIESGAILPEYYDAIIESTEEYGPYYILMPGMAMPHARPEAGVQRDAFSLITLQNPVVFSDGKEVSVLLALAATSSKIHTREEWCENFAQGDVLCECCAKISHKALFTRPNAKLDSFKWP